MLPRAGAATVERRRRCKPKDVATDAAHGFTDTQAQKFPRFECQGFAIHLPHEFTREPTSVGGADLEDDDSPNVPEDATHELLGDLALARKNNERIDFRFEAYTTHLIHNGAILRARECVNNVVVVFVAPSAGEVERLRSRAAPILRRWSRRERPLFLFWNQDRWHEVGPSPSRSPRHPPGTLAKHHPRRPARSRSARGLIPLSDLNFDGAPKPALGYKSSPSSCATTTATWAPCRSDAERRPLSHPSERPRAVLPLRTGHGARIYV